MDLFFFNPGCEIEVAADKAVYSLPKYPAMLERDLSVLPMCFARKGDCVLISKTKDVDFLSFWRERFQCEFIGEEDRGLTAREFDFFRPWGISPRILRVGEKYKLSSIYHNSPIGRWMPEHKLLFSRATSVDFFEKLVQQDGYDSKLFPINDDLFPPQKQLFPSQKQYFPSKNELPCIAKTMDEAAEFLRARSDGAVFKAIFGSSGRGVRILKNSQMTPNLDNWLRSIIKTQGAVECEHLFDKIADFSMHYDIVDGMAKFVGVSTFATSETGAYIGSRVGRLDSVPGFDAETARRLSDLHVKVLNDSIYAKKYCGPLGIDCMVYRQGDQTKINPCIEINCRYSMGRLSMQIAELVDAEADFYVFPKNAAPFKGCRKPEFSNGKLVGGFLPLTPSDTEMFSAGVLVI